MACGASSPFARAPRVQESSVGPMRSCRAALRARVAEAFGQPYELLRADETRRTVMGSRPTEIEACVKPSSKLPHEVGFLAEKTPIFNGSTCCRRLGRLLSTLT